MTRKERYALRKSQHRCTNCGKQDNRTLEGKVYCEHCAEMINTIMVKRYNALSKSGLCVACGKSEAVVGKMCKLCNDKAKTLNIKRTIKRCREAVRATSA